MQLSRLTTTTAYAESPEGVLLRIRIKQAEEDVELLLNDNPPIIIGKVYRIPNPERRKRFIYRFSFSKSKVSFNSPEVIIQKGTAKEIVKEVFLESLGRISFEELQKQLNL